MKKQKIIKPNGECYAELWIEGGLLRLTLTQYAPRIQIALDEKAIPQLIQALQILKLEAAL